MVRVALLVFSLAGCCCIPDQNAGKNKDGVPFLPIDSELFIMRFGAPDSVINTDLDRPRPLVVTRTIVYKKENVRAIYVPSNKKRPVKDWEIYQYNRVDDKKILTEDEVLKAMEGRDRQRKR